MNENSAVRFPKILISRESRLFSCFPEPSDLEPSDLDSFSRFSYNERQQPLGNKALRDVFQHYATQFADRCELQIADTGTVPTLLAEGWYDDDAVAWAENGAKSMPFEEVRAGTPDVSAAMKRLMRTYESQSPPQRLAAVRLNDWQQLVGLTC